MEMVKKMKLITIFWLMFGMLLAPEIKVIYIEKGTVIDPYQRIMKAIGMVESSQNALAYNPDEGAYGYFQIKRIRLIDYNKRFSDSLTIEDMFDYQKAAKVFKSYAKRIGWRNSDEVILSWNCHSKAYLNKVKKYL